MQMKLKGIEGCQKRWRESLYVQIQALRVYGASGRRYLLRWSAPTGSQVKRVVAGRSSIRECIYYVFMYVHMPPYKVGDLEGLSTAAV